MTRRRNQTKVDLKKSKGRTTSLDNKHLKSKKVKKVDVFADAFSEDPALESKEMIHFIKSSFHLSFVEHFRQKFYDTDLWRVIVGSFCSALFVGYQWFFIAIISFLALMTSYWQWKSREKSNAIVYCSKMLSKDPDRLKYFLSTISAPKNLSSNKAVDAPQEWINDILAKFWPHINSIAQTQIDSKGFSKQGLDVGNGHKIYFERFTLGDKPPALTGIHVRQSGHRKDEIVIILKLIYFGNCLILFSYKTKVFLKAKAGVKDVYFRGNAVVVLRPMLEVPPFIGGISVCLQDIPLIDYNGINLANIADNKLFKNFLVNILKNYLVSPNKIYVPLLNNANIKRELKYPLPIGLCFIEIIEAEDLPAMDSNQCFIFEGSSDSFCKVKVGDIQFSTTTIYSSLNPYFGENFSAPIHDFNDNLKLEVFDKDSLSADDFMGSIEFKLSDVGRNYNLNGKDKWLPIGKSLTGSLHFRCAVFELSSNKRNIEKIESAVRESSVKFPVGILSVYIYYVSHISTSDEEYDFKPVVKLKFSEQTFQTKAAKPPKRSYYYLEESSHFLVYDLKNEILEVCVVCQEMKTMTFSKVFGECNIAVKDIIHSKNRRDMILNQDFPIKKILRLKNITEVKNSGFIRMFLSLKVCKFRRKLLENLKVPPNIQANIEQTIENKNSITKLYREPMSSLKNPIRSMKIIGNRVSPFGPQSKTIVAEDISKIAQYLDEGSWLTVRVKWPDRTSLHIEVLKLIRIPMEIVGQSFKYAVCVKLSLKQSSIKSLSDTMKRKIGLKGIRNKDERIRGLQKRYTHRYPIVNYVNDIIFNERLIFKISSANNIDSHFLEFFLILYKPRKFFAVIFDSRVAASSLPIDIPKVDFRGDPIELCFRINLYERFKRKSLF